MAELNLAAVVLAAGASTRMGKNKLALPWGDSTVLETTISQVDALPFCTKVVVLGHEAAYWQLKWQKEQAFLDWQQVLNPEYLAGQSQSVIQSSRFLLAQNQSQHKIKGACFFLGDQPLLKTETIAFLLAQWQQTLGEIVIPRYEGKRGNPVIFPAWTFSELLKLEGDQGARGLFALYPHLLKFIEVADRGIVVDLDTPGVYAAERALLADG